MDEPIRPRPMLTHEMRATGKGYSGDGWLAFAHAEAYRMDGGETITSEGIHIEVSRSELTITESLRLADALTLARGEAVACAEQARRLIDEGRATETVSTLRLNNPADS